MIKCLSVCLQFIYGLILGGVFYELILIDLKFDRRVTEYLGLSLALILALGNAISLQIHCTCLLILPNLAGKRGRSFMRALLVTYVLTGPVYNLISNGYEVARVFSCSASLTFNLTKNRYSLMLKPFQEAILEMKSDLTQVQHIAKDIKDVSDPVMNEIEVNPVVDDDPDYFDFYQRVLRNATPPKNKSAEFYEAIYKKKIHDRCKEMLKKTSQKCNKSFASVYNKCRDVVGTIFTWLLCWPMKLTFICNIVNINLKTCDPSDQMKSVFHFGSEYLYLKKSQKLFSNQFKNISIKVITINTLTLKILIQTTFYRLWGKVFSYFGFNKYFLKKKQFQTKPNKYQQMVEIHEASESAQYILHDIKRKKEFYAKTLKLVLRLISLISLRIVLNSQAYLTKYHRDIEFENVYVTKYFKKIDERRKSRDKSHLLPLKKTEKTHLIDVKAQSVLPNRYERNKIIMRSLKFCAELIIILTILFIDYLVYDTLTLIRKHAVIKYTQIGKHDMHVKIEGTGLIANLLRSLLKGFKFRKRFHTVQSNVQCLPNPIKLSSYNYEKITLIITTIWISILVENIVQRFNRTICANMYPKREKTRILHLYNKLLKQRRHFKRNMKRRIKRKIREEQRKNDLDIVENVLKKIYCLKHVCDKLFPRQKKCLICDDKSKDLVQCPNEKPCRFAYCCECWSNIDKNCYACLLRNDKDDTENDTDNTDEAY